MTKFKVTLEDVPFLSDYHVGDSVIVYSDSDVKPSQDEVHEAFKSKYGSRFNVGTVRWHYKSID